MYSIHNRNDLELAKKLQETKSLIKAERLKEKLGRQDFHYDMEEVFEPVTENQKQIKKVSETQIQALNDSTESTTKAIRESSKILNKNLQKSIQQGIENYDEITKKNNEILTNLVNSNQVDSSIVKTISNLLNDKNKSQFSLEPVEGSSNFFTINSTYDPQLVQIRGSTLTFQNGESYDLNNPDLKYFITNTQFEKPFDNLDLIYSFLHDMKYNIKKGDMKSDRYNFIKDLLQPQIGSGLKFIFLPSDPNELVDQLQLLYLEKVGGNDNPQLDEQITAIADTLLRYECITTHEHENIISNFKKDLFPD